MPCHVDNWEMSDWRGYIDPEKGIIRREFENWPLSIRVV